MKLIMQGNIPAERCIKLNQSESSGVVPRKISLNAVRGRLKGGIVDDVPARILTPVQVKGLSGHKIGLILKI